MKAFFGAGIVFFNEGTALYYLKPSAPLRAA